MFEIIKGWRIDLSTRVFFKAEEKLYIGEVEGYYYTDDGEEYGYLIFDKKKDKRYLVPDCFVSEHCDYKGDFPEKNPAELIYYDRFLNLWDYKTHLDWLNYKPHQS